MPAIVTQNFKSRQVDAFLSALDGNQVYMFIGNPYEWDNEFNPPLPIDNDSASFNLWDKMYGVRQVSSTNYTKVIRRRNWVPDTVYDFYSTDMGAIAETNFYVMTTNFQVYKCLWNNNNGLSTVEPSGVDPSFTTADGYVWAYMYTIDTALAQTFLTPEYMPVVIEGDVVVASDTTAGSITAVRITSPGTDYLSVNFTGGSPTIDAEAYAIVSGGAIVDVVVVNGGQYATAPTASISGGNGAGAQLAVTFSAGTVQDVNVVPGQGGSGYIAPTLSIIEGSGTGFVGRVIAKNGSLSRIIVEDNGQDYTFLSLEVNGGTGGEVVPVISPIQGHGYNAELELGAFNIMFSANLAPTEVAGKLPPSNRYREVGIIVNPGKFDDPQEPFELPVGTNMIKLKQLQPTPNLFIQNEIVQSNTGARAKVVFWDNTAGVLWLVQTLQENFGAFDVSDTITGATSGKAITIDEVIEPDLAKYTGEFQYIESREPIQRTASQFEEIKIVIEF
jgi:hypothetical protein